jgi:hypothetical protein
MRGSTDSDEEVPITIRISSFTYFRNFQMLKPAQRAMPPPPFQAVHLARTAPDAAQGVHGAESSAPHDLAGLLDQAMPSHVKADHHDPVRRGRSFAKPVAVGERKSGGRIDPDVQAGVERRDRGIDLQLGGQTQRDRIQSAGREHLRRVVVPSRDAEAPLDVGEPLRVHVRGGRDADVRHLRERRHVLLGRDFATPREPESERSRHRWLGTGMLRGGVAAGVAAVS